MVAPAAIHNEFEALCLINRADQARALGRIAQADRLLLMAWMAYDDAMLPAADQAAATPPPECLTENATMPVI